MEASQHVYSQPGPPNSPPNQPLSALMQVYNGASNPDVHLIDEMGKLAQEDVEETVSDEVFSNYKHTEILTGCRPHPGDIVEAGSLAAVKSPPPEYPLADSLPAEIITSGKLSSLQLEGILYACQRHQIVLPSGSRAGFFMGDAAGVGKGRQISGIIMDNYCRGRRKHIWFSISTDLVVDARRDMSDIDCHIKVIEGCQQLDKETKVFGLPSDFKEGVVFSTYATLVSSVQRGSSFSSSKLSRLQQLVDWCGGTQFEGCLIFDECHKAKNFVPGKESASTKVALAVTQLQKMLPLARVVYCSATGVSDVKNMAFMERMGLWGEGAAFRSFEQFLETVHRKGLGVAEMMAMEMKSSGMYVSRGLSFKQAEFVTEETPLTKEQTKMYNMAAHVWGEVQRSLEAAIDRTASTNNRIWSSFWAAHQRFFKQLCIGVKVPAVVEMAKNAMNNGCCVVIGLQTTGEASMESELTKAPTALTGWVSLCREILIRFIQQHFPTVIEGQSSVNGSVEDEWAITAKQMLLGFAKQIKLPDSPLDEVIDKLGGPDNVAEMTGRKGRMVERGQGPRYETRHSTDEASELESLNVRERNLFMAGKKLVAIISDAASTGISLHADQRVANQRRRVHITIELPWSADKAVQQLGRSHRSNQSSGPLYKLVTTNLGGEKRFASAVARRLQSLGAITKGDRRAATGADLKEFNFETPYGRSALKTMYDCICKKSLAPGIPLTKVTLGKFDFAAFNEEMLESLKSMGILEPHTLVSVMKVSDKHAGNVGKFLNRILGLSVLRQNMIFNYFSQCLESKISGAKKEGRYNEGLVDITATSVELVTEPREVFKSKSSSNNPTKYAILRVDRGMPWEKAVKRLENNPGKDAGFYVSQRQMFGKTMYVLATPKEGSAHSMKIARPNTGVSTFDEDKGDLFSKYKPVSIEDAEKGWREQYENAQNNCIHGIHCRTGPSCTVGARCYKMHLLCGGIVTMMSLLEMTIARFGGKMQLTKAESVLRVVRVQLDSGERMVGIRYPELLIPMVEKTIQEEQTILALQSKQTTLSNGLQLGIPTTADVPVGEHVGKTYTKEEVAGVIDKYLIKATTPARTIKTFFKPKDTRKSPESDKKTPQTEEEHKADEMSGTSSGSNTDLSKLNQDNCRAGTKSQPCQTGSLKRARSDGQKEPACKKVKQSSIMAMFAKAHSRDEPKKERSCPICSHTFESEMSNAKINEHIDNCLIE